MSRFSNPVRFSSTAAFCPDTPMWRRTSAGSASTSMPATTAEPESGRSSVVRIRTAVVLPAPLGPSTPSTEPSGTAKESPQRARTSLYDLVKSLATMASFI